jgi:hypothetical protein
MCLRTTVSDCVADEVYGVVLSMCVFLLVSNSKITWSALIISMWKTCMLNSVRITTVITPTTLAYTLRLQNASGEIMCVPSVLLCVSYFLIQPSIQPIITTLSVSFAGTFIYTYTQHTQI